VMDVRVSTDPAADAAAFIADRLRRAVAERGRASLAVSGGSTAPPMVAALVDPARSGEVPWADTVVVQVDERIAPDGHGDRNAGQLVDLPAEVRLMPVTDSDVETAARRYGAAINSPLDVVHLGIGSDGHTASWPPEPHADAERAIATNESAYVIDEFNGRRRMTLGPSVVNAARARVVLATGVSKADVVARWISIADGGCAAVDLSLPIAALAPADTVVFLDEGAAGARA